MRVHHRGICDVSSEQMCTAARNLVKDLPSDFEADPADVKTEAHWHALHP